MKRRKKRLKIKNKKKFDLIVMLIWPIIASLFSIFFEETQIFHQNFFVSIILFLALPSLYLALRAKRHAIKAIIPSLFIAVPLMIVVEYIGHISLAWSFPPTIFPIILFDVVIIEVLFWVFFNTYFIIIFYEYFLNHHVTKRLWEPRLKSLMFVTLVLSVIFLVAFYSFPFISIPYFYFFLGIFVFVLPVALQFLNYSHKKKVIAKMLKTGAYFFYLSFVYEILALTYGWWGFPSENFIGWFSIFHLRFPLEELFWWIILFAFAILTYYEFFDDDGK